MPAADPLLYVPVLHIIIVTKSMQRDRQNSLLGEGELKTFARWEGPRAPGG